MPENETGVAPESTSPEAAKTEENLPSIAAPAAPAGGAGELAGETKVSIIAVVRGYLAEHPIEAWLEPKLEQLKAEILAKVSELVTPIVAKSTESTEAAPAATVEAPMLDPVAATASEQVEEEVPIQRVHSVGDPVKVWVDLNHKLFLLGAIVAVHGAGDAYDVRLEDEDGSVAKVPADGLEFDDRR